MPLTNQQRLYTFAVFMFGLTELVTAYLFEKPTFPSDDFNCFSGRMQS